MEDKEVAKEDVQPEAKGTEAVNFYVKPALTRAQQKGSKTQD